MVVAIQELYPLIWHTVCLHALHTLALWDGRVIPYNSEQVAALMRSGSQEADATKHHVNDGPGFDSRCDLQMFQLWTS